MRSCRRTITVQLAAALLHAAVMSSIAYRVLSLASSPVDTAWSRNHQGTLFQAALSDPSHDLKQPKSPKLREPQLGKPRMARRARAANSSAACRRAAAEHDAAGHMGVL